MKQTLQAMLLALVALMMPIGAWAQTSTIDLSTLTGTYVINDSEEYTFTGTSNHGIKVESGNPRIILNNTSITVGEGSAIDVASGSNATIFVLGDNTIGTTKTEDSDVPCGGIFVAEGGTVNITSNGTDNILRAHGTLAAAIGGKYDYDNNESYNAGSINISNVTVYAYTNSYYAAAIGAAGRGSCGTINITNAVIYAYGAGDRWTSAPGIGSAWSLIGVSDTIPVVIISDSEVHTFRHNSGSDYIGYLGDVEIPMNATGSINCGDGGSVKNSTIYCYTGLTATTTDKTVKYGALGSLLVEDENGNWVCEGEHTYANGVCANCGYKCTHEGGEHTTAIDNGDGTHCFTCSICGEVTEEHNYTLTAESDMLTEVCACGHTNGTITVEAEDKTYDGKAVEVVVARTSSLENADITIAYTKDGESFTGDPIEAGSYTATVTMEEKSASVEFIIVQANVEIAEIALEYDETVYDGTEKTPAVTAVVVDGVVIEPASYDVAYADNTAVGTATVNVTFKGNYTGAVNTTFEILAHTTRIEQSEIRVEQSEIIYDLSGRRVEQPTKGIYIVNGRKVVMK